MYNILHFIYLALLAVNIYEARIFIREQDALEGLAKEKSNYGWGARSNSSQMPKLIPSTSHAIDLQYLLRMLESDLQYF